MDDKNKTKLKRILKYFLYFRAGTLCLGVAVVCVKCSMDREWDKRIDRLLVNLENKEVQGINDVKSIESFIINFKENTASIVVSADDNVMYCYTFACNEKLEGFAQEYQGEIYNLYYEKDIDEIKAYSLNKWKPILDGFMEASEGNLLDCHILDIEEQKELMRLIKQSVNQNNYRKR